VNKQLNELKENTCKQMNENKKTIQDMKEEINKNMEILKNNQSEINNSISQTKISIESLERRVVQIEKRVSRTEDKVEELDQTVKDHKRMLRKYEWNMQDICDTMKRPSLQIMGVKEGKEKQTKGRIIAENFLNLEKESPRCRKLTEHQTFGTKKETQSDTS
jgi:uncharacterized coiled-coil protein SlyX